MSTGDVAGDEAVIVMGNSDGSGVAMSGATDVGADVVTDVGAGRAMDVEADVVTGVDDVVLSRGREGRATVSCWAATAWTPLGGCG